MNVVHLTDSPFFGGPERQILGLSRTLPSHVRTTVLCFREHGSAAPFVEKLGAAGVPAGMLDHATPLYGRMVGELRRRLREHSCDLLICHGYKADILGLVAARSTGTPVISVSRGWTAHTRKVRFNEALDRRCLRLMDAVICVSDGQAEKVRRAGVPARRVRVIRNAIDHQRFGDTKPQQTLIREFFPQGVEGVVAAVGRLSPEKGFDHFIAAAAMVLAELPNTGFLLIGDGPSRTALEGQIAAAGVAGRVVLTGFRDDVDRILPQVDILAQSSHTEGLPNVVLEACAARIPVVATAVGGTPEVVDDGVSGYLIQPGDPAALAARLLELLRSRELRERMGAAGREHVRAHFSFARQTAEYERLFAEFSGRA